MFFVIGLAATAAATLVGYFQSRRFVASRLRYVDAVQSPLAPLVAGGVATLVAVPVVALLPLVGIGTAILFGLGVGTGVASGAKEIRRRIGA